MVDLLGTWIHLEMRVWRGGIDIQDCENLMSKIFGNLDSSSSSKQKEMALHRAIQPSQFDMKSYWTRKNSSFTLASTLHLTKSWLAGKIFYLLNIFFHPNTPCLLPDRLGLSVKILHKARHWGRILILKVFWEMSLWLSCNWSELAKGWESGKRKERRT